MEGLLSATPWLPETHSSFALYNVNDLMMFPQSHVAIKTIIITIYEYRDGLCGDDHKRATNVLHVNHRMVER